jgi:hypothetical protein
VPKRLHPRRLHSVNAVFIAVVVLGAAMYLGGDDALGWWILLAGVVTVAVLTALNVWAYRGSDSEKANPF